MDFLELDTGAGIWHVNSPVKFYIFLSWFSTKYWLLPIYDKLNLINYTWIFMILY